MRYLSALILALSITLSAGSVSSAPVEVTQASIVSQDEADQAVLAQDAQVTWDDYLDIPQTGETVSYTWVAYAYEEPQNLPATDLKLQSLDFGVWYVYRAQMLSHA